MKKENISLFLGIIGIGLFIIIVMMFLRPTKEPAITDEASHTSIAPTKPPVQQPPKADSMNPDYGELTEDQIKMADVAIGKLLNSSQGITPPMITVKNFEPKEFADASLDCPKPDMTYAQVVTPGYQIVLEAKGKEYDYRLTDEKNIILCEK